MQFKQKISNNTCVAAGMVILLGVISEKSGSTIFLIAALAVALLYSFMCPKSQLLFFVLFLIAPNRVLTIGSISAPAIVMIIGSLRSFFNKHIKTSFTFVVCSVLLMIVSVFTYINGQAQMIAVAKIIIVLYFIRAYTETEEIKKIYIKLIEACSLGCLMTVFLTLLINPKSLYGDTRFSLTGGGGENVLGVLCAIMALHLFCIMLYGNRDKKIKDIIYIAVLGLVSVLTGSRSALLGLAVGIVCIFLITICRRNIRQIAWVLFLSTVAFVILYFIMKGDNIIAAYIENLLYRTQKLYNTDISNGRFELWNMYFKVLANNPNILWFGGMSEAQFGINQVAHNMIIEQVAGHGIIGSAIITVLYGDVVVGIMRSGGYKIKINTVYIVPLIALILSSMFSHTMLGIPQTMMLFLSTYGIMEVK